MVLGHESFTCSSIEAREILSWVQFRQSFFLKKWDILIYIDIYTDVYWLRRVRLLFFAFNVCFLEGDLGKGSAAAALFFQVFYGFMQVIIEE
jgi:hypothetical protein